MISGVLLALGIGVAVIFTSAMAIVITVDAVREKQYFKAIVAGTASFAVILLVVGALLLAVGR